MVKNFLYAMRVSSAMLAAWIVLTCAVVFAAEPDSPQAQLDAAFKSIEQVNSGKLKLSVVLDTMVIDADGEADIDFVAKNEKDVTAKGQIKCTIGSGAEAEHHRMPYYIVFKDNKTTLYYQDKGTWYKDTDKVKINAKDDKDKDNSKDANNGSPEEQVNLDGLIKSVELGKRVGYEQTYIVTVDGKLLASLFKDTAATQLTTKKDNGIDELLTTENLSVVNEMADIVGEVVVDTSAKEVRSVCVDLSSAAVSVANAFIDGQKSVEPEAKEAMKALAAGTKLTIALTGSDYNKVKDIVVPEDVLENAIQAPKDDNKDK